MSENERMEMAICKIKPIRSVSVTITKRELSFYWDHQCNLSHSRQRHKQGLFDLLLRKNFMADCPTACLLLYLIVSVTVWGPKLVTQWAMLKCYVSLIYFLSLPLSNRISESVYGAWHLGPTETSKGQWSRRQMARRNVGKQCPRKRKRRSFYDDRQCRRLKKANLVPIRKFVACRVVNI